MGARKLPGHRRPGRRESLCAVVCLELPLHRLQDLVGAVEGLLARVPYAVDHLLWGFVALGRGGYLFLPFRSPITPDPSYPACPIPNVCGASPLPRAPRNRRAVFFRLGAMWLATALFAREPRQLA